MSRLLEDRDESMGRLTTGRMLRLEGREERQHRCEEEEGTSHTLHLNVRLVHNNNDCVGSLDSSSGCFKQSSDYQIMGLRCFSDLFRQKKVEGRTAKSNKSRMNRSQHKLSCRLNH
jgi:hypothetical protein